MLPDLAALEEAYSFARLINHQQGFELLDAASNEYTLNLDFESIARIWSNGCIIKSSLMNRLEGCFGPVVIVPSPDHVHVERGA